MIRGLAVAMVVLLAGCAGWSGPREATLEVLTDEQEAWDGREVAVVGVVAAADAPRHHWLADEDQHRVGLVGVDAELLDTLVGRTVRVTGTFSFVEGRGRAIRVDDVAVAG